MFSTLMAAFTVLLHKHRYSKGFVHNTHARRRFILVRRVCLIVGLLYGYRALTMIITVLPAANPDYLCDPQVTIMMMLVMMMTMTVFPSRPSKDGFARLDGHFGKIARLTPVFL